MNQPCREIRKTTKLRCSLKQKTKLEFQLSSFIIFLAWLFPSFWSCLKVAFIKIAWTNIHTRNQNIHITTKTIRLNVIGYFFFYYKCGWSFISPNSFISLHFPDFFDLSFLPSFLSKPAIFQFQSMKKFFVL